MEQIEPNVRLGYLGPAGTFTEQALRRLHPGPPGGSVPAWPAPTVPAVFDAIRRGQLDSAVVPFENSVEGSVSATLDELIRAREGSSAHLQIRREVHIEVQFDLLVRADTQAWQVDRIATHPHAAAQTRRWVAEHYPDAEVVPEASTARAAALVAEGAYDAAIAAS